MATIYLSFSFKFFIELYFSLLDLAYDFIIVILAKLEYVASNAKRIAKGGSICASIS